jgi:hypothetical protein
MFAVGPPTSLITPRKSSMRRSARTSRSTLSAERDWMIRPSCSVIEQKLQPPKQPRIVTIECLTVSNAGILLLAVAEVGLAHEGQVVERVHVRRLERPRRRVQVHRPLPVRLQQRASVARVRLVLERPRHLEERRLSSFTCS